MKYLMIPVTVPNKAPLAVALAITAENLAELKDHNRVAYRLHDDAAEVTFRTFGLEMHWINASDSLEAVLKRCDRCQCPQVFECEKLPADEWVGDPRLVIENAQWGSFLSFTGKLGEEYAESWCLSVEMLEENL